MVEAFCLVIVFLGVNLDQALKLNGEKNQHILPQEQGVPWPELGSQIMNQQAGHWSPREFSYQGLLSGAGEVEHQSPNNAHHNFEQVNSWQSLLVGE